MRTEPMTDAERIERLELLVSYLTTRLVKLGDPCPAEANILNEEVQRRPEWQAHQRNVDEAKRNLWFVGE